MKKIIGVKLKKNTNQSRKQFKTKQITIQKISTKFQKKFKNKIIRDEMKNKIQLKNNQCK